MKKFVIILISVILLVTVTATFAGCGDKDISDLKKQLDDLKNNLDSVSGQYGDLKGEFTDLNSQYAELEKRVKKLETTMSLLDTVGESAEFKELKNKVAALQKDLLNNTANDTQVKSQVTQMQLVLDKIYSSNSADETVLSKVQNQLNTLYGEVNRVLPFENGKEYEVKLNGVVYYTVSILIEYHDGVVQSEQDIKKCVTKDKHFCGSVRVYNKMINSTIKSDDMLNAMLHMFDNAALSQHSVMMQKEGINSTDIKQIESGKEAKWYFYVEPIIEVKSNYRIIFRIPNINLDILTLDNVWGDENGIKPPIVGTKG